MFYQKTEAHFVEISIKHAGIEKKTFLATALCRKIIGFALKSFGILFFYYYRLGTVQNHKNVGKNGNS